MTMMSPDAPNRRLKVLLLAYYFPPDNEIGAARPARLVKGLAASGFTVQVIARSASENANRQQPEQKNAVDAVYRVADRQTASVKLLRRVMPYNDRIEWRSPAFEAAAERITRERPDVIVSTAPPFSVHLVASALSKRFGIPWVADFRDPIVDNPFRARHWAKPFDQWMESGLIRQASRVVVNTEEAAKALSARYPAKAREVEVIWNGFDPEDGFGPLPLRTPGKIRVTHVGTVYGARHPGAFLASVDRLIENGRVQPQEIDLEFVGPFEQSAVRLDSPLCERLRTLGVLHVTPASIPATEARRLSASASHLLLLDQNEANKGIQVPGKLFEYIRTGRPILAFSAMDSMSEWILKRCGVPFVQIHHTHADAEIDQRVMDFVQYPVEERPPGPNDWFKDSFSLPRQTEQWKAVLEAAVRKH